MTTTKGKTMTTPAKTKTTATKIAAEDKAAKKPATLKGSDRLRKPTSHSECTHAKGGVEGKKARAACRRERAAAENAAKAAA